MFPTPELVDFRLVPEIGPQFCQGRRTYHIASIRVISASCIVHQDFESEYPALRVYTLGRAYRLGSGLCFFLNVRRMLRGLVVGHSLAVDVQLH